MTTATAAANAYDLASWVKLRGPNFKADMRIAQLLNQCNEVVQDIVWAPGNQPMSHLITQQTGLPPAYYRLLNQAVSPGRGQTAQIQESMGIAEAWQEHDVDLVNLMGDQGAFLYQMSVPQMESLTQQFAKTFFYGDTTQTPGSFLGMSTRYSTISASAAANAVNCISAGGSNNANTSIWLITHGLYALHGIFPQGSSAGITHRVWKDAVVQGSDGIGGSRLEAIQQKWQWKAGLALWDWRWCVRICNIDINNLIQENNAADLVALMLDAQYQIPSIYSPASTTGNPETDVAIPGRRVWYTNRQVRRMLHKQCLNKSAGTVEYDMVDGRKIMHLFGTEIRNCDQIVSNENNVT